MHTPIDWTSNFEVEDWAFIKQFILSSGSLKDMAKYYEVTYPTVRLKLDRLIQKIKLAEKPEEDSYIAKIKQLVINDQLDYELAKMLIQEYRYQKEKK